MDDDLALVADVLRRKLPEAEIAAGEHKLSGTALIDLDVAVAKSEPTFAKPNLPWKSIVAVLAGELARLADVAPASVIARAARKACSGPGRGVALPEAVEAALDEVRGEQVLEPRQGLTKVTGDVSMAGFVPATLILPGWREVKEVITAHRAAAG